jgi:hypothetical protein
MIFDVLSSLTAAPTAAVVVVRVLLAACFLPLPRCAGVMAARRLLCGANTPW